MGADELVDRVDDQDRVVATTKLGDCLRLGLLHRAVAVLVTRSDGRVLLQRRSTKDLWHPGLWTLSSTGHVLHGERYEAAAIRELSEELGLLADLNLVGKFLIPTLTDRGLTENEWVTLFSCRTDAECKIDPVEVDSVRDFDPGELDYMVARGPLTPDAKFLLGEYLRSATRSGL